MGRKRRRGSTNFWNDILRAQRAAQRLGFTHVQRTGSDSQVEVDDTGVAAGRHTFNTTVDQGSTDTRSRNDTAREPSLPIRPPEEGITSQCSIFQEILTSSPKSTSESRDHDGYEQNEFGDRTQGTVSNEPEGLHSNHAPIEQSIDEEDVFQPFEADHVTDSLGDQHCSDPTCDDHQERCDHSRSMHGENHTMSNRPDTVEHVMRKNHSESAPLLSSVEKEDIVKRISLWEPRLTLTGLLAVIGSVRYTVDQYGYTKAILDELVPDNTFPSYPRTQRYFQFLLHSCFPDSEIVTIAKRIPNDTNRGVSALSADQRNLVTSEQESHRHNELYEKMEKIRVFMPSGWAKLDVATSVTFDEMYSTDSHNNDPSKGLEASRIIRDREDVTSSCSYIYVDHLSAKVICKPGDVINVSGNDVSLNFDTKFNVSQSNGEFHLQAKVAATWSVGTDCEITSSYLSAIENPLMTPVQKNIVRQLRKGVSPEKLEDLNNEFVCPGDICTLLIPEQGDCDMFPVIIHRFWRHEDGIPSVMLYSFRLQDCGTDDGTNTSNILQKMNSSTVQRLKLCREKRSHQQPTRRKNTAFGKLRDGTPFLVYRILLYCDDFQRSSAMYPRGSAGGCYFMPLSLPPESRRKKSSIRIISLTPPGVSTNEVLHFITDDLVSSAVRGVEGYTPLGVKVRIFVDVVGFIGDYPASTAVTDVMGHVARAPCTLCTFRRLQDKESSGSKFGYTTNVHARNSTFLRHGERQSCLRSSDVSDADATRLGMIPNSRFTERNFPLVHLQRSLDAKKRDASLTEHGISAVPCMFDAYRSNVIAPDHLLTGLSKDILNAVFKSLASNEQRKTLDVRICAALRDNGLLSQREVFNSRSKSLHSMTLSEIFCVLLVTVPVLRVLIRSTSQDTVLMDCAILLDQLQRLISLTYWWPLPQVDGKEATVMIHNMTEAYFSDLRKMSKEYVKLVDDVCSKSEIVRKELDKPNLHRLIELYEHSIPAFGHVREFMELVFESAHQPLKRCIARSNNHNSHLFAVEHCVANDWQGRVAALRDELIRGKQSDDCESSSKHVATRRGIRRLFLGSEADLLDEAEDRDLLDVIDHALELQYTGAVLKQFQKDTMISNFSAESRPQWRARGKTILPTISELSGVAQTDLKRIINISKQWIEATFPDVSQDFESSRDRGILLYRTAKRLKLNAAGRQVGKPSGYDTIYTNTAIVINVTPEALTRRMLKSSAQNPSSRPNFFAILSILQRAGDVPIAICFRCLKRGETVQRESLDPRCFKLVLLTSDVRRIALYHACDKDLQSNSKCTTDMTAQRVNHTQSLLGGAKMYFHCRVHGYPPRMA